MYELLFCPEHGLLALVLCFTTGVNANIFYLTFQMFCGKVVSWLRRLS